MSESQFNMNTFLNEYKGYNTQKFTAKELAERNMEARDIANAEQAVTAQDERSFLKLTMSGKIGEAFKEAGIGEFVLRQVADTAESIVTGWLDPIADYLEQYENIFDQRIYNQELQELGKQHFFNNQALQAEVAGSTIGTNFSMDM